MTVLFYRWEGEYRPLARPAGDVEFRIWQPREDGLPRRGPWYRRNLAWWVLDSFGLFARDGFLELTIWRGCTLVSRLTVTPRWYRFPFMAREDLQLGDLWTRPDARRCGLARSAVLEALRLLGGRETRFWYVVGQDNIASIRLIESCGFRLVATGQRTHMLGFRALGRFRIEASGEALANEGLS